MAHQRGNVAGAVCIMRLQCPVCLCLTRWLHCPCCCVRAGVELSKVEVKFNNLEVSADVNIGSRGMPTVANAFINAPLVSGICWLKPVCSLARSGPSGHCSQPHC